MNWSKDILMELLNANIINNFNNYTGFSIDSRSIKDGDIFFALRGDNFDGHDFLIDVQSKGAVAVIVDHIPDNVSLDICIIVVDDVLKAMHKMASYARDNSEAVFIGITGSVGKTSTKELLGNVLSLYGECHITKGNFNNHIGMPLSLLRMPNSVKYVVLELGMNHSGEIDTIAKILRPNIAIITNVGYVHIGNFNSLQDIAAAKAEIIDHIADNGHLIINKDNQFHDYFHSKAVKIGIRNILSFGYDSASSVVIKASEIMQDDRSEYLKCIIVCHGEEYLVRSNNYMICFGYIISSVLAVIAIVDNKNNVIKSDVLNEIERFLPVNGRGDLNNITIDDKSIQIINDSYNANPESMRESIISFSYRKNVLLGRKIAILGDMLELGDYSKKCHEDLSSLLMDFDFVILIGEYMKFLHDKLQEIGYQHLLHFNSSQDCQKELILLINDSDLILIKGSRAMHIEDVFQGFL